jgi:hypothetical protein
VVDQADQDGEPTAGGLQGGHLRLQPHVLDDQSSRQVDIEVAGVDGGQQRGQQWAAEPGAEQLLDQLDPRHGRGRVDPLATGGALWLQQALFLVVAQSTGADPRPPGHLPDAQLLGRHALTPSTDEWTAIDLDPDVDVNS